VVEAAVGAGFAVAVPTGSEGTWNAGDCCGQALLEGVDDVAFLDAVLADAAESLPIDPDRVIVAGFSNGGMMAYRYACQRAGRLAGVMVVEGVLAASPCRPAAPIDLLQIHQLGDANVPFAGTDSASFSRDGTLPGVVASFETWSRAQRCGAAEVRRDGEIESRTARCRGARARLLVVDGGSHAWPTDLGTVDATQVLIDFFGLAPAS
jgi:polyhydroxybutyrate depolymerase